MNMMFIYKIPKVNLLQGLSLLKKLTYGIMSPYELHNNFELKIEAQIQSHQHFQ